MAVFSSKKNYICGAYFTGSSFLVLEFDNRREKRIVRTKGEIEVENYIDDEFEIKDKVKLVEAAKRIRKNTKSKAICINKKLDNRLLTHFFEIFSVAGFEEVSFVEIKETLNDAFRKEKVHGTDCFLVIENKKYYIYISDQDGVELLAKANSLSEINLEEDRVKEALKEILSQRIEIFGLEDLDQFEEIEDLLFSFGYKAVIGNVWQNSFSIDNHIPSVPFKESSRYALPVALALYSQKGKEQREGGESMQKSISSIDVKNIPELNQRIERQQEKVANKEDAQEVEPKILEERLMVKDTYVTSINLPVLEQNKKPEKMATYIPDVKWKIKESWETYNKREDIEEEKEEAREKIEAESVVLETDLKSEPLNEILDEVLETSSEAEKEVDVDVVKNSKKVKKEEKKEKKKKGFWEKLFSKKKKEENKEERPKNKKKKKKKSKKKKNK